MTIRASWIIALSASLAGCNKDKDKAKPADTPAPAAEPPKAAAAATAPTPAKAESVDSKLVDAAKKVATDCKWNDDGYYDSNCQARQDYARLNMDKGSGPALVQILEGKTPGMQYLASDVLYSHAEWLADDKALQERVIAVAATLPKDGKGGTANKLGRVIGFFHLDTTGLFDKAKAIVDNADAPEPLRVGIVNWILAGNPESEPAYTLVRDAATKGSPAVKIAALVGLSGAYNKHATDEMCKLWIDALPTLPDEPGSLVAAHLTNGDLQVFNENEAFPYNWAMISSDDNKCPPAMVDAALKHIDKQVAANKAGGLTSWWGSALKGPSKSKNATDAQKKLSVEIAKKYVDNAKYGGYQRGSVLENLVDMDPAAAKSLADKYANDKDGSLKSAAERAHKKLDKKS
jgi:hypothetical protein